MPEVSLRAAGCIPFWLVMLVLSFPVAAFCAILYIILMPFVACVNGLLHLTILLLRGVQLPYICVYSIIHQITWDQAMAESKKASPGTQTQSTAKTPLRKMPEIYLRASGWILFWLVMLVLSYLVAVFCAILYIILIPFVSCVNELLPLTQLLLRGEQLPYICVYGIIHQSTWDEAMTESKKASPGIQTQRMAETHSREMLEASLHAVGWIHFWLVMLVLSFLVAVFCAILYIILIPFVASVNELLPLTHLLLRGIQLPYICVYGIIHQSTWNEAMTESKKASPGT